ncbi:MAG: pilus assembly protein TadG-related protein [Filomicrobium sp.]
MFKLRDLGRRYLNDKQGNIAPLFGLMAVPMLAVTGGAIDIGQAMSAQKNLQNALDAASVAVCVGGAGSQSSDEILRAYLNAELENSKMSLLPPPEPGAPEVGANPNEVQLSNTQFDPSSGTLEPSVKTTTPTTLLKLLGINDIDVEASSSVKCGAKRLELSLVLDVTGSMNSKVGGKKKIDSMKDAGLDVLNIFDRNLAVGATRIALVPFSEAVNVGSLANNVRGTLKNGTKKYVGHKKLKFKDRYNKWKKWNASTCVSERLGSQAYTDAAPNCSGSSCSAPVGHVYTSNGSCRPSNLIQPLTSDKNALRSQLLSYQPNGGTAGHIGATWGWYLVSDKWASLFPAESAPEVPNPDELIKATIIMTDGEFNEQYRDGVDDDNTKYAANNGSSSSQFEKICEAMKDPNGDGVYDEDESVVVYTIGFGLNPNSSTANRLKSCASDNTKYFFPYDGEELRAAFKSIGKQLSGGQAGQAIVQR